MFLLKHLKLFHIKMLRKSAITHFPVKSWFSPFHLMSIFVGYLNFGMSKLGFTLDEYLFYQAETVIWCPNLSIFMALMKNKNTLSQRGLTGIRIIPFVVLIRINALVMSPLFLARSHRWTHIVSQFCSYGEI